MIQRIQGIVLNYGGLNILIIILRPLKFKVYSFTVGFRV